MVGRNHRPNLALGSQGQAVGQVFLDGDEFPVRVRGEVDDRKTAERKLAVYRVLLQRVTTG